MANRWSGGGFGRESHPSRWLALLRIYTGFCFLALGAGKIYYGIISQFPQLLDTYAARTLFPFYQRVLLDYIIPHATTFAIILIVAEIIIGLLYILGLLTRVATFLALVVTLNYIFALGGVNKVYLAAAISGIIVEMVLAGAAAGRIWGFDASLYRRTLFKFLC